MSDASGYSRLKDVSAIRLFVAQRTSATAAAEASAAEDRLREARVRLESTVSAGAKAVTEARASLYAKAFGADDVRAVRKTAETADLARQAAEQHVAGRHHTAELKERQRKTAVLKLKAVEAKLDAVKTILKAKRAADQERLEISAEDDRLVFAASVQMKVKQQQRSVS